MKIALAQINTTIGDFSGNADKVIAAAHRARDAGAELCLFPEQCLPGYPAHDLLERKSFIDGNLAELNRVARSLNGIAAVVGFAEPHYKQVGKGLHNSAALIDDRRILSIHQKSLLPTYDVFDEHRYFDPAESVTPAEFHGKKLGITICEDVWNDPDFWARRLYNFDPGTELIKQGAEFIVNISASPFTLLKRRLRRQMLKAFALHHRVPLLFVNSVGGNDELVFDGSSLAISADGETAARAPEFKEHLLLVDTDKMTPDPAGDEFTSDEEAALEALTLGTQDYAAKCGFKRALLGLSGGVDSALVAVIAARAFGAKNTTALLMPSPYSSPGSITDAVKLADNLKIEYHVLPIGQILAAYLKALQPLFGSEPLGLVEENLQARIRGNLLMAFSNRQGHLLLSTGNKSELATGYCTLYGDMAGGLAVLSDIPKTMVYRLSNLINRDGEIIPQAIIDKPPSAELCFNQKDTDSLPPYDQLDALLDRHILEGFDHRALVKAGFDPAMVQSALDMVTRSEYKRRQAPPGIKITSKAFGVGRRMPLAQRWRPSFSPADSE